MGLRFRFLAPLVLAACTSAQVNHDPPPAHSIQEEVPTPNAIALARSRVLRVQGDTRSIFGLNQILGTGQSLAQGVLSTPVLSTTQPFANKMFVGGVGEYANGSSTYTSLSALIEAFARETMSSGMANLITERAAAQGVTHDALVSLHALSDHSYRQLRKGTAPYAEGMTQTSTGRTRTLALGKTHGVTAITCVHGEKDSFEYNGPGSGPNPAYDLDLIQWQLDYDADVKAITGQSGPAIPMLHTQMSATPGSDIPLAQLRAHVAAFGKVILVGPKYFLSAVDGSHLSNHASRQMGEYYAKVYDQMIVRSGAWDPLRPTAFARSGSTITITFAVPAPPLVFDTTIMPAIAGRGFDYVPAGGGTESVLGNPTISGNQVIVTLTAPPVAWGRIRYAQANISAVRPLPDYSTGGNLRDSDTSVTSRHGYSLYNWCVHFDQQL